VLKELRKDGQMKRKRKLVVIAFPGNPLLIS